MTHSRSSVARRAVLALFATASLAAPLASFASDFPNRPIRMIVPFPPGGATDLVSRRMALAMEKDLGQTVIVDNRGGAGGIIGAEAVAKAEPDGYTILSTTAGVHVVNPAIYPKLPYDPLKSFEPISQSVVAPLALVVLSKSPFKTAQELIDFAKKNPDKLSYGSAGSGSSLHQNGEMFKDAAGVNILHVPYKGAGPAVTDFRGGRVDMMFSYVGSVMPSVKTGEYRLLAIGSPKRLPLIADTPTVGEILGQPGFDADTWTGLTAPAGTPPAIIARLNKAVHAALEANKEYFQTNGYVIIGGTSDQMKQRIQTELKTVTPLLTKIMGPAR
ncbi:Bug family tripartite tricarboxylate transporter substrate binding protein [Ottowia thiooxydans]|uniref:Bug family tripartite tricarboxylate transporter substrate binding protein n=1 Tax=Ottowia thiooxydans TaxID=219182 RepID=UPI00041ED105|nr:tripartite tricarboxylate transporter substrate-binding protein [Ottowia thiooxydans]